MTEQNNQWLDESEIKGKIWSQNTVPVVKIKRPGKDGKQYSVQVRSHTDGGSNSTTSALFNVNLINFQGATAALTLGGEGPVEFVTSDPNILKRVTIAEDSKGTRRAYIEFGGQE